MVAATTSGFSHWMLWPEATIRFSPRVERPAASSCMAFQAWPMAARSSGGVGGPLPVPSAVSTIQGRSPSGRFVLSMSAEEVVAAVRAKQTR